MALVMEKYKKNAEKKLCWENGGILCFGGS